VSKGATGEIGVALCSRVAIKRIFAPAFEALTPHRLLDPHEVEDPADVAFALSFVPDGHAFAPYPNLRLAASIGAGAEAIVRAPSLPPHVPVLRMREKDQANQMAAFALFHVVYWHRRFDCLLAAQAQRRWARRPGGRSPSGATIGVLGYGLMGRRIAAVAASLGHPVRSYSRRAPEPPDPAVEHFSGNALDAFLEGTDILVAVLPGTPQTEGMIDAAFLRRLKPGAALVQLGRGGQVVEEDLLAALDEGHLRGASLDVFTTEPLPPDHPFWRDPRVLVTPHTASEATAEAVVLAVAGALDALARGREPDGIVDRARGY